MSKFTHYLVPGPTRVTEEVLAFYSKQYDSSDLEDEFFELYGKAQKNLSTLLQCPKSTIVIQAGEAMVSLWGGLKSVLVKGDNVLSIATGVFGYGIGEMAKSCGAHVDYVAYEFNQTLKFDDVKRAVEKYKPKMITVVHCETPSGTINPIHQLGKLAHDHDAILYVDFVSSGGAMDIKVDDWGIDIGLLGTQKALNLPPDLGITTISERAWKIIEGTAYDGYDAFLPFKNAREKKYFPYTHNWGAIAALEYQTSQMLTVGIDRIVQNHLEVARYCQKRIVGLGLTIYAENLSDSSPTVTTVVVPSDWSWAELNAPLRKRGVCFAGSYGKLENKVFRIGHMGSQANLDLVRGALDILEEILNKH
jgi:aspartate aminotransferase-like enzyme